MLKLNLLALAALLPVFAGPPLSITTEDVTAQFPGAPRIQSFAFAQWRGNWIFVGGRAAGYHATGGAEAEFLRAQSNHKIWVIDTNSFPVSVYCASLDDMPASLAKVRDHLSSTAQLFTQDGDTLYVAGGYGQNSAGQWVTYPILSAIHLPTLVEGVKTGTVPPKSIRFVESPHVQSTGGELVKLDDGYFYVVMGHNFNGSYTSFQGQGEKNTNTVSQVYLDEIRKLKISIAKDGALTATLVDTFHDEKQFHRRDLNVVPYASASGSGLAVYGGVFTPDQLGWTKPVYLPSASKPTVDDSFEQKMNGYACATMLFYDTTQQAMYTTFFGGISRHYFDGKSFIAHPLVGTKNDSVYLDGMQWSDQISTIRKSSSGTEEFVQPTSLPAFIGSDAAFIPALPNRSGIIDVTPAPGKPVFVGYLYGGIRASPYRFPYTRSSPSYNSGIVPTKPNDLILKVYVEWKPAQ